MSTTILPCGCFVTRSMFGDRPIIGYGICMYHSQLLNAMEGLLFKDLWQIIENNPVPEMEAEDDTRCDHLNQAD